MNWTALLGGTISRWTAGIFALLGTGLIGSAGAIVVQLQAGFALEEALTQRTSEIERSRRAAEQAQWPDADERRRWEVAETRVKQKILAGSDSASLVNFKEMSALAGGLTDVNIAILSPDQFKLLAKNSSNPAAPVAEPPAGWGERSYVKLSFQCEYNDLLDFFTRLSRVNRLMEIESFKVTRNPPNLSVQLILRATSIQAKGHA